MNKFYVYAYLDLDGTPFYIGRGYDDRAYHHLTRCSAKRTRNKCPQFYAKLRAMLADKSEPDIIFVITGISLPAARIWEKAFINEIGRIELGDGPLTNLTDGMTPGPIAKRNLSKASKAFYSSLTPEEKKTWGNAAREWHTIITPEEKERWRKAVIAGKAAMTPEQKKHKAEALSATRALETKEDKAHRLKTSRTTRANKTPEEKQREKNNRSKAQLARREKERKAT